MAGLAAARVFADAGHEVTVFEKSRGVGGRMGTRREPPWAFNHGAQSFTARSDRFERAVREWLRAGVARVCEGRVVRIRGRRLIEEPAERPRFVGVPGMSSICRHLARNLDVRLQSRVTDLDQLADFDARVVATPAEQACALAGELDPAILQVGMEPCFVAMGVFAEPVDLGFCGAFVEESPVSWIALAGDAFVLHADARWTASRFSDPPSWIRRDLMRAFRDAVDRELPELRFLKLHRWRYARATRPLGDPFLWDPVRRLGMCGDWCRGSRVEAAYLSGVALAERVIADPKAPRLLGTDEATGSDSRLRTR
jgi:predicted NAD/FAD-dependent oxidoreductase